MTTKEGSVKDAIQLYHDTAPAAFDPDLVRKNRLASKADETKRALVKNWRTFEDWCRVHRTEALPVALDHLEAFLLYLSDAHPVRNRRGEILASGLRPASINQTLWAINTRHRLAGYPSPGESEQIKTAMSGIRRRKGSRKKQQAPLTIDHLRAVPFRDDLKGKRDKALLLLGFAGCLRRSELVALQHGDLEQGELGLRIYLAHSKTDQEGQGAWVDILRATHYPELCPVRALEEWVEAAGISEGRLFRSLTKGARPRLGVSLSAVSVDAVVKWAAGQAGLDPSRYGGHSLRAGSATYLSDRGKSPTLIAKHGRWKSLDMVLTYCRGETAREIYGVY